MKRRGWRVWDGERGLDWKEDDKLAVIFYEKWSGSKFIKPDYQNRMKQERCLFRKYKMDLLISYIFYVKTATDK